MEEFLTNSRQDVIELLREFNVSSSPPISEIRALIVSVTRYSLLEGPRAAILAMRAGFQSVTGSKFSRVTAGIVSEWYQLIPEYQNVLELISN